MLTTVICSADDRHKLQKLSVCLLTLTSQLDSTSASTSSSGVGIQCKRSGVLISYGQVGFAAHPLWARRRIVWSTAQSRQLCLWDATMLSVLPSSEPLFSPTGLCVPILAQPLCCDLRRVSPSPHFSVLAPILSEMDTSEGLGSGTKHTAY